MSRQSDLDNHANQLNPNHDAYWESRGQEEQPDDWEEKIKKVKEEDNGENQGAEKRQQ